MEKLKNIFGIVVIFVALAGMTEVVSANPCPSVSTWSGVNQLSPAGPVTGVFSVVSDSNNPATYSAQGTSPILEVCGASSTSNAQAINPFFWTAPPSAIKTGGWPNTWFQFSGASNPIPVGPVTPVGTVTWSTPGPQGNEIYLLHISDPKCPGGTCFVIPGRSPLPTPELSTILLTASGLFGLVLVTKKYKKQ